jgi:hypothetical protein
MERRQRRIFPEAFKREAVDRVPTERIAMRLVREMSKLKLEGGYRPRRWRGARARRNRPYGR